MKKFEKFIEDCRQAGCSKDQTENLINAGILLQPKQLAASAAARLCDKPDGPKATSFFLSASDGERIKVRCRFFVSLHSRAVCSQKP